MAVRRAAETGPNPNTPEAAEQARRERPRVTQDEGTVRVRALVPVSGPDGEPHYVGETFTVAKDSVEQALARGLVEEVTEDKKGRK